MVDDSLNHLNHIRLVCVVCERPLARVTRGPCGLMQEAKHFEDAFQAYERGVALFKFPHSKDIWTAYLTRFVVRYGGKKLERARDLFRHALREVGLRHSGAVRFVLSFI